MVRALHQPLLEADSVPDVRVRLRRRRDQLQFSVEVGRARLICERPTANGNRGQTNNTHTQPTGKRESVRILICVFVWEGQEREWDRRWACCVDTIFVFE
jgi:hypothetical protein